MAKKKEKKMIETVLPVEPTGQSTYIRNKSKFEVYGEEMIEKEVKQSGNSGRVYLPPEWVGKHVKIIRID
jgi:putative transposon-encoded protein